MLVYGVLFLEVEDGRERRTVFDGIRKWWDGSMSATRAVEPVVGNINDGRQGQKAKG